MRLTPADEVPRAEPLRVLVVDDDPLARLSLTDRIAEIPWALAAGEASTGAGALAAVDRLSPDVLLLDIQLPDIDGFEVVRRLVSPPAVVFTTAYDRFAVAAFELRALDYVLKPVAPDRLYRALSRARETLPAAGDEAARFEVVPGRLPTRIFARSQGQIVPIECRQIERIEARDDYVAVFAGGGRYLLHLTLGELLARLDPNQFARVHRSHAVNWAFVASLSPGPGGRLHVVMRDGQRVVASRDRSQALRALAS